MKRVLFFLILSSFTTVGFSTTWVISSAGLTFTPPSLTINAGDDVNFSIAPGHDVLEVSQATWNANGSTPLPGGFSTPFGGALVPASFLTVGTHYYICQSHISAIPPMKGIIIVQSLTYIEENKSFHDLSVYPNPANNIITLKKSNNQRSLNYYVLDNSGTKVLTGNISGENTQFDISCLAKGIYFIQLEGDRTKPVKFIRK